MMPTAEARAATAALLGACLVLVALSGCSGPDPNQSSVSGNASAGDRDGSSQGTPDALATTNDAMATTPDGSGPTDAPGSALDARTNDGRSGDVAADGAASKAGVVVGAGVAATCAPLCVTVMTPTSPSAPDWSYENLASCVLPNSLTGKNQPCTVGQPIPPPPANLPGVVILDNSTGISSCVPLCVNVTTPSNPSLSVDWSYENNSSCVLPNSVTGKNQTCTTGQPVPPPAPRAGILLVLSGVDASCVALCVVATVPSSPTAPDWAYENNAPCVLPKSPTATGKLACTAFGPAPSFVPLALTGTKAHNGFYTANGQLNDAYGHPFVMRGIANPHLWFDSAGQYLAYKDLPLIASYGTNTIRVVWDTTTIESTLPDGGVVSGAGDAGGIPVPAPASLLAQDLYGIVQQKMVPMVELHGASGLTDTGSLMNMVNYYIRPEVKKVLTDYQDYLLINIANEWSGPTTDATGAYSTTYVTGYHQAISALRQNGISHTLVIDAPGFGQIIANTTTAAATQISNWFTAVQDLIAWDAGANGNGTGAANLLFSVHMYGFYPASDAANANVNAVLNHAGVGTTIPLIVGEFGWTHSGTVVAWQFIMQQCVAKGIGYVGWSWFGNAAGTAVQALDIVQSWGGPLTTTWGVGLVQSGVFGIQATAKRASIFP